MDLGVGAQQLVFIVGLDTCVGDLVKDRTHFLRHLHIIDRKGKTTIGTHLTGTKGHTRQCVQVLLRNPRERLSVHIIDRTGVLHEDRQLFVRTKTYLLTTNGGQRLLVRSAIRVDT